MSHSTGDSSIVCTCRGWPSQRGLAVSHISNEDIKLNQARLTSAVQSRPVRDATHQLLAGEHKPSWLTWAPARPPDKTCAPAGQITYDSFFNYDHELLAGLLNQVGQNERACESETASERERESQQARPGESKHDSLARVIKSERPDYILY